jgi:hypothetical protein
VKLLVKTPAAVEKAIAIPPVGSYPKSGKIRTSEVESIRKEMTEMHGKTMRALEDLTSRIVALETTRIGSERDADPKGFQQ